MQLCIKHYCSSMLLTIEDVMNILFHTAVGVSDYCHTVGVTVIFNLAFPTDKFISYVL